MKPEEYVHSTYRSYVTRVPEGIVSPDTILGMSSGERSEAARCYRDFVENAPGDELENPLRKVYGGMILGSKRFIKDAVGPQNQPFASICQYTTARIIV